MKKRIVAIIIGAILMRIMLTGCTAKCEYPGCDSNAKLSGDYCETHQNTVDTIDGIKGLFK